MMLVNLDFTVDHNGKLVASAVPLGTNTVEKGVDIAAVPDGTVVQHFHMGGKAAHGELIGDGDGDGAVTEGPLSGDCGPAEVNAGAMFGDWAQTEKEARTKAIARARQVCADQCQGGCSDKKKCNFLATKTSVLEIESRENNSVIEFRAKASASGKCQCE